MFISHKSNLIPSFFENELQFSELEIRIIKPWFICEVPKFDDDSDDAICTSTYLVANIEKLQELATTQKIDKTYIATPSYMTKTENWSLLKLKSIAQSTYISDGYEIQIYRFDIENGKFLYFDLYGAAKNIKNLIFKTILEFN